MKASDHNYNSDKSSIAWNLYNYKSEPSPRMVSGGMQYFAWSPLSGR